MVFVITIVLTEAPKTFESLGILSFLSITIRTGFFPSQVLMFNLGLSPNTVFVPTKDGFIAPTKDLRDSSPQPFWISNTYAKQLVHQWRAEEQAILVGTNTVLVCAN